MDTSMASEDKICNNDSENRGIIEGIMYVAAEQVCEMTSEDSTLLLARVINAEQKQQLVKSNNTNDPQEPKEFNSRIEAIVDQRDHLLQISARKEHEIKRLKLENQLLEQQLKSAVKKKSEALARLDLIEGKELNLSFKEKEMELDKERLHNQVTNLTDDLNKNRAELMAVRQDYLWATNQLQIDFNKHTEQLRLANSKISELTETNQMLKSQNEEYASKLTEQINESSKVMAVYDNDLRAKVDLVELYKANCDDYQAHIKELESSATQLKQLVNETADECGIFETELNNIDEKYQIELDERDEIIKKLRQELKHANILIGSEENASDILSGVDGGVTMTEMYDKYCTVVKELHNKQKDYNDLEMETKKLFEGVQESAKKFKLLQLDNKKLKAANDEFIEDKKNLIVEKVVTRVKLEDTLIRCDFLEKRYRGLEMPANQNKSSEKNVKSDGQDSRRSSQYLLTELKEQNQTLLQLVKGLYSKIEEMEETETKSNLEIRELREANENLIADRWIMKNASSTNVCHKSVGVSEYQLMIGNDSSTDILSILTQKKNAQKIEDKLQSKMKELQELKQEYDAMQNEKRDLTAEKIKLSAELNASNMRNNGCNDKMLILEEQNKMFVNTISEHKIAIKGLTTENINFNRKLSSVESRCEDLRNECRKLSDTKKSLEIEVETLKKELVQAKISIQMLEIKLKVAGEDSMQLQAETQLKLEEKGKQMLQLRNEVDRCQKIIADMTSNSISDFSNNMEETEIENIEIENHVPLTFKTTMEDSQSNFLNSLQLKKPAEKDKRKSSSSNEAVTRKRSRNDENSSSSVSSNVCHMTTRLQRRARVSFKNDTKRISGKTSLIKVNQEDEDVEVNVCDEIDEDYKPPKSNSNIELELRREIRTRSQAQFLHDALYSDIESQEVPGVGKLGRRKIKSEHVVVDQQSSDSQQQDLSFEVRGGYHVALRSQIPVRGRGVVSLSETSVRGRGRSSGIGRGRSSGRGRGGTSRGGKGRY